MKSFLPALLALALISTASPLVAQEPAQDPVLQGVLKMLGADLSSDIVLQWLNAADTPRMPTAAEMVALRQAGASDELLSRILELASTVQGEAETSTPSRSEESEPADHAPVAQASTTNPSVAKTPVSKPAPAKADGPVDVVFTFSYSPYVPEDDDEWQLYAYLDGKPLTYVPLGGLIGGKPLQFDHPLEPGRHVLRLTQERHEQRKKSVIHDARVGDLSIPFTVETAEPVKVEVRFRQSLFRTKNPISYRISQGDRVDLQEELGGEPDRWAEICEDIEMGLEPGRKVGRSTSRRLEKCLRWDSLWPDHNATPRAEVLEALAKFDYRPVPRPQTLH